LATIQARKPPAKYSGVRRWIKSLAQELQDISKFRNSLQFFRGVL
jgi:hypothetical protein